MNIVILGAGAVGGYFGGRLALAGLPVHFLVRPKRYEQLQQNGLEISSSYGQWTIHPQLAARASDLTDVDVVVVGVKNYHLEAALPELMVLVEKGARILPLLNGMDHLTTLTDAFGRERVLGGTCYIEATLDAKGRVLQTGPLQDIVFGPRASDEASMAFAKDLHSVLEQGNFRVTLSEDIETDMWQKFTFLTAMSSITAGVHSPIGPIVEDEVTRAFLCGVIAEIVQIARADGAKLPDNAESYILERMQRAPANMTSSLHRDLEKGLELELDSLQGAFLRRAAFHQMAAPHLTAIYALLHPHIYGRVLSAEMEVTV
ncbi:MAG: ketopantoate reductase family protein [Alicyclobacillaceae bacterium]|nr:ketopantoate reductase family protein [Alicyclobacillaceae bacterium]